MWILGHTAFAYLLVKLLFPSIRKECNGKLLLFIFIFANITDATHFGPLRTLVHNTIGTLLFSYIWIRFFRYHEIIDGKITPILLTATTTHIIGDLLFSYYHPFLPFSDYAGTLYAWNSTENIIVESLIGFIFLVVFVRSGDLRRFQKYSFSETLLFRKVFCFKDFYTPKLFPSYLAIIFALFAIGQLLLDLGLNINDLLVGVWYVWTFTLIFLAFAGYSSMGIVRAFRTHI
jgi:predicted membrane protein